MISKLGLDGAKMRKDVSITALRCSYAIYLQRKTKSFVKWEL